MNASIRKYLIEFGSAITLYSASVFLTPTLLEFVARDSVLVWLIALIPVIPTGLVVWAIVRQYRRMDEFQQHVMGETSFIAAMITISVSFAYGFLEAFAGAPPVPIIWVTPVFFGLWIPIQPLVSRRYR